VIRIQRGAEPAALAAARKRRTCAAARARATGKKPSFSGYEVARAQLYAAQRRKCAYCERLIGAEGNPIEHFRPKAEAWRGDPWSGKKTPIDRERYWWLAWSYSNLLLACSSCNCVSRKGNWFPLASGSRQLQVPSADALAFDTTFDASVETPMLVDPGVDDPLDHIAWVPLDPNESIERMEWRPVHKTERGRVTIKILGLELAIADQVGDHIRHNVHPRIVAVLAMEGAQAQAAWALTVRDLLADTMPFLAATYGALDHFVPVAFRERLGLVLARPGAPTPGVE
jgi:uncharacterized protein (TIGR02646 family)